MSAKQHLNLPWNDEYVCPSAPLVSDWSTCVASANAFNSSEKTFTEASRFEATCSTVCCRILSWGTIFGTSNNCVTISGTGTSGICSTARCKVRSWLEFLGTSKTCSTTNRIRTSTTCSQVLSGIRS